MSYDTGTEDWGEYYCIDAVYYANTCLPYHKVTYINTYDGGQNLYQDHTFFDLQENLISSFPGYQIFLSRSRRGTEYGEEQQQALNININIAGLENATESIDTVVSKLCTLQEEFFYYADYVNIVLWRQEEYNPQMTGIYILQKKDDSSYSNTNAYNLDNPCFLSYEEEMNSNISTAVRQENYKNISSLWIPSDNENDQEHQQISELFDDQTNHQNHVYYAIQSFIGFGDYMHYGTDAIIYTDMDTNESYVCCEEGYYKVLKCSEIEKQSYYDATYKKLQVKDDPEKVLNPEIFVPVKWLDQSDTSYVIYLRTKAINPDENWGAEVEYSYEIAKFDESGEVAEIMPLTVKSYYDCFYRIP